MKGYFKFILASLILTSCIDEVPLMSNDNAPQAIVIHAFINPDSVVNVNIAKISELDEPYVWISNAKVSFLRNNRDTSILNYISGGNYVSNFQYRNNDSLYLSVDHALYKSVIGIKVPSKVKIRQIDTFRALIGTVGKTRVFRIYFKDSAYNRNFYRIYGIRNLKKYVLDKVGNRIDSARFSERISLGGNELPFLRNPYNTYTTKELIFSDETFNGVSAKFEIFETLVKNNSATSVTESIDIYLENISESIYSYLNTRNAHLWQQNSITQLPSKVNGNLGAAYGVFGAYSTDKYRIRF